MEVLEVGVEVVGVLAVPEVGSQVVEVEPV